jgi:hypothetical protein
MPPPKYYTFESLREELSYEMAKEGEDEAMVMAADMSRHGQKLSEIANPGKGNKVMMMACIIAAEKVRITHPADTVTKGKAHAAMTRTQVHLDKEATVASETSRRMLKAKRSVIRPHHHQAAPMAADRLTPETPNATRHKKVTTHAPN